MTRYRYPQTLNKGDKVVIVSPSGWVDVNFIDQARSLLESWGLHVEIAPHARNRYGRFSGTVGQRLSDLQNAMNDPDCRLIFCSRGGYGAIHLADKLDFTLFDKSPKWLVGYSDITVLHMAWLINGIASIHAPMARHISQKTGDESTFCLKSILFGKFPAYTVDSHFLNKTGNITGTLFGGNLSVLCGLSGTKFMEIPSDGILFIEDIGEPAYKIDRMMWNLKLTGVLEKIKGIIIGSFTDCPEDPLMYSPIYETISQIIEEYKLVSAFDFPVGHTEQNYPLLQGGKVNLNVMENKVELLIV